jgi:Zn-dependent protease
MIQTRLGQAFVASAGILTNLFLAVVSGIAFKVLYIQGALTPELGKAIFTIISVNVSLAFFNLIPIPPFDGMAILESFFPQLSIRNRLIYNPLYMVGAILVASVLYGILVPPLFNLIQSILL